VAFAGAVRLLAQRDQSVRFIAPMAGERQKAYFMDLLAKAGLADLIGHGGLELIDGQSHACIAAADAVLAASGTATLEVALFKKPMVIAYKVMRASWEIMRHMGYLPWIGLPNILAREFVVPEFLQHAASPQALADAVWFQLTDEANRVKLQQRFLDMHHSLLRNSAEESSRAVLEVIDKR
jgi:lipid-A-disaccharide synthase